MTHIRHFLRRLFTHCFQPYRVGLFFVEFDPHTRKYRSLPDMLQLKVNHARLIHALPKNADGAVSAVENVTHTFTNDGVADIHIADAADPLNFQLVGLTVGKTTLTIQADAHVGEGEALIVGSIDIEVLANEAVGIEFTFGDETPIV